MEGPALQQKAIPVRTSAASWLHRFIIFAVAGSLFSQLIRAQTPDLGWIARFGGLPYTNEQGMLHYNNFTTSIALDRDGNVLVTGMCDTLNPKYIGPKGTNYLPQGTFLAKLNTSGKLLWTRTVGFNGYFLGVTADATGNIFVSGYTNTGPPSADLRPSSVLLIKYDPNGNFVWSVQSQAANFQDDGYGLTLDEANNIYLTGFFSSSNLVLGSVTITNIHTAPYPFEEFIAKIGPQGNVLWAKPIYGTSSESWVNKPWLDFSGDIFIGGTFAKPLKLETLTLTNKGPNDIFVAKYDPTGLLLGARDIAEGDFHGPTRVTADSRGNIYAGGTFMSPQATFGNLTLTKRSSGLQSFLAKFSGQGNAVWARQAIAISGSATPGSVVFPDAKGNIYQTGYWEGPAAEIDFGGGRVLGKYSILTQGPLFSLTRYDGAGTATWVADLRVNAAKPSTLRPRFMAADKHGGLYISGTEETLPVRLPSGDITMTRVSFLAKLPAATTEQPSGQYISW